MWKWSFLKEGWQFLPGTNNGAMMKETPRALLHITYIIISYISQMCGCTYDCTYGTEKGLAQGT